MCACTFTAKLTPAAAALPLSLLPSHSAWSRWPGGGPAGQPGESSAGDSGSSEASVPCSLAVESPPGPGGGHWHHKTRRLSRSHGRDSGRARAGPAAWERHSQGDPPRLARAGGSTGPRGPVGPGTDHPSFNSESEPRPGPRAGPLRPGCHCRLAWGRRMPILSKVPVCGRAGAHLTRTPGLSLIQTGT